jgi:RNA polymerase sigma-70 factor (ECF subfamily)
MQQHDHLKSKEAFEALYEHSASRLLVYIARRLHDSDAAAELWAECWAIAFERWPTCRAEGADAEAWVFGIARRRLASYYRSGAIERRALERLGWTVPIVQDSQAIDLERIAELDLLRSLLKDALAELPERRRRAVQLRIVSGLSYREVAARMGCSEQAARAHVSRGLRRLGDAITQTEISEIPGGKP